MGLPRFLAANLSSGLIWATIHVVPAALGGVLLTSVGAISGRLLAALAAGAILLFVAFLLARLLVIRATPWALAGYRSGIQWLSQSDSHFLRRIARAGDPDDPRLLGAAVWGGLAVMAAWGLAAVTQDVLGHEPLTRADLSISQFVQALRSAPLDRVMVFLTDFGDGVVISVAVGALLLALLAARQWRSAVLVGITFAVAAVASPLAKFIVHRPRPIDIYSGADAFAFPSGHSTFATLLLSVIAFFIAMRLGRSLQIGVWMAAGFGVIAIAFSRVYLGAHWPSDVMGGVLLGAFIGGVLALLLHYKAAATRPARISGLVALAVFLAIGTLHARLDLQQDIARYAPVQKQTAIGLADWLNSRWAELPRRRIDLFGETEELLSFQTAVPVDRLAEILSRHGWRPVNDGGLGQFLKLLSPTADFATLPPWPLLHEGRWPILMMTRQDAGRRLVLRLWPSDHQLAAGATRQQILVGSLTEETLTHPYHALTAMFDEPAPSSAVQGLANSLRDSPEIDVETRPLDATNSAVHLLVGPQVASQQNPSRSSP